MDIGFRLFPEQASSVAASVDALYFFLLSVAAIFTVGIFLAIVFLALYYHRSANRNRTKGPGGQLWILETAWIVIPFLLTMVMFVWGAVIYLEIEVAPDDALEIQVVGKQWMWKTQHAQGRREINELHVPINQPVKLRMISEDVIHSFYIPAFRIKQDVLPGRYTTLWFEATKPGKYYLFCAEYCGTEHADMQGVVYAQRPADYAQWLAGGTDMPPVSAGENLFTQFRCHTCHHMGSEARCPPLENLFGKSVQLADGRTVKADEQYLRESILQPNAQVVAGYQVVMPTYEGQLTEEQVFQLVEYIKSLSGMSLSDKSLSDRAEETQPRETSLTPAPAPTEPTSNEQ